MMPTDVSVLEAQWRIFDMATGVVMYQLGCRPPEAQAYLRERALSLGKPVQDFADVVVRAAEIGCRVEPHRAHAPGEGPLTWENRSG